MINAKLCCIALFAPLQKNLHMHARGYIDWAPGSASCLPLQIAGPTREPKIFQQRIWSGRSAMKAMSRPVAGRVLQTRQTLVHKKSHVTSCTKYHEYTSIFISARGPRTRANLLCSGGVPASKCIYTVWQLGKHAENALLVCNVSLWAQ